MDNNILSFLGLMHKAGSLALGGENAYDAARTHRARLLVLAEDCGPNTAAQIGRPPGRGPHCPFALHKSSAGRRLGPTGVRGAGCHRYRLCPFPLPQMRLARPSRTAGGQVGPGKKAQAKEDRPHRRQTRRNRYT